MRKKINLSFKENNMTNDSLLTEKLNETGLPFQEWISNVIKKSEELGKNYIIKEYPFTFPPTVNSQLGISGSIDILAIHFPKDNHFWDKPWVIYTIECKKSKTSIKNWCFLKSSREGLENETYFVLSENNQNNPLDFKVQLIDNKTIAFTLLKNNIDITETVIAGYETNDLIKSLNRSQEEKIYKSLLQVMHGSRFVESKNPLIIKELNFTKEKIESVTNNRSIKVLFVPIVVTTSNLWVANFDPSRVVDGVINPIEVKWEQKDWILYDFGLPDYLRHDDYINRAVFVVNSGYFPEFINKLSPLIR